MQETQIVVGVASVCSLLAIVATLVVVPSLYSQINEISLKVHDGVQEFRVNTDSAWNELMEVQITVTPPAKPRENPFVSIFRSKRQLPGHCQCAGVQQPQSGEPGQPGVPGQPGAPCPDVPHVCQHCPAGPPGKPGDQGPAAKPVNLAGQASLDRTEEWAHPDLLARKDKPEAQDDLGDRDNQDNPDKMALYIRPFLDRRDNPLNLEHRDSLAHLDDLGSLETKDNPEPRDTQDSRANPEHRDSLVIRALLEHPAKMPRTAPARPGRAAVMAFPGEAEAVPKRNMRPCPLNRHLCRNNRQKAPA
ncbi:hypothetical protein niasHT_026052 [Heterodera trifolii]|uniref:Nematode cuticle collagen N-terminal domain-containing protein n=1 Tax=Heterodera trifolii TaxID=157864 RepID=A0ABD2KR94_9BILA